MDLHALAAAQEGVFGRTQARAAGYSAYRISRFVARGEWVELYGGRALRAASSAMTPIAWDWAALLATGARAALGGPSAARWSGVTLPWSEPFIVVPPTSRREPLGITVLREAVALNDLQLRDGVLITRPARTVVDCLRVLPHQTGVSFLDRALQQRWITFAELVERTGLLVGRRGAPKLARHVRVAAPGTRSEAERRMAQLLRAHRIRGWAANVAVDGVGILDFAFAAQQVAIEIDGRAWHSAGDRFQSDRQRQNRLVLLGWTVLRFTWEDITRRPDRVIAEVRAALAG